VSGYDRTFFDAHRAGALRSAGVLVPLVLGLVRPRSVVDVGCGAGTWLAVFREQGVDDLLGIDGAYVDPAQLEIPREQFLAHDLATRLSLDRTFDLAVTLEVAEHLPPEAAASFVSSLAGLAPCVLFSAAIPHQAGEGHVNCRWPEYWAALFADHDFVPIDCFRRRLWRDERVEWWYAQNVILYARRDRLDAALERELARTDDHTLPLVHPALFLAMVDWGIEQNR